MTKKKIKKEIQTRTNTILQKQKIWNNLIHKKIFLINYLLITILPFIQLIELIIWHVLKLNAWIIKNQEKIPNYIFFFLKNFFINHTFFLIITSFIMISITATRKIITNHQKTKTQIFFYEINILEFLLVMLFFFIINQIYFPLLTVTHPKTEVFSMYNKTLFYNIKKNTINIIVIFVIITFINFTIYQKTKFLKRITFQNITTFAENMLILFLIIFTTLILNTPELYTLLIILVGFGVVTYTLLFMNQANQRTKESGIKYFLLSTFATIFFLAGVALTLLIIQTDNIILLNIAINQLNDAINTIEETRILIICFTFFIASLLFKIAGFPFTSWPAEIYEGSSFNVIFLFIVLYKTIFIFLLIKLAIFLFDCNLNFFFENKENINIYWKNISTWIGIMTTVFGSFLALIEKKVKRFLAYSSINHLGLIVITIPTIHSLYLQNTINYLIIYILLNCTFFSINNVWSKKSSTFLLKNKNKTNNEIFWAPVYLNDFKKIKRNDISIFLIIINLLSFAGIPPFAGFLAKILVLFNAIATYSTMTCIILVIVSITSTYYYLKIIKIFNFEQTKWNKNKQIERNYYKAILKIFSQQPYTKFKPSALLIPHIIFITTIWNYCYLLLYTIIGVPINFISIDYIYNPI